MNSNKLSLHQPHDHFFKVIFSDPEKVQSFLRGALPQRIISNIQFETLREDPGSYIDEELKDFYTDVVY